MLTEHEEKLIQRYYIYPKIAITAVIMALALGVPFILLEMIDDLVFHDEEVIFWGLYVYLGFAALYLILFCYCTLRAKLGMRKEEWQELQRRLKVRQQQSDYSAAAAGAMAMGAAGRLMQKSQNKTVRGAGTARPDRRGSGGRGHGRRHERRDCPQCSGHGGSLRCPPSPAPKD